MLYILWIPKGSPGSPVTSSHLLHGAILQAIPHPHGRGDQQLAGPVAATVLIIFWTLQDWGYPLVNVYITNWKITKLLMGKSIISMVIFNSYVKLPEGTRCVQIWVFSGSFWIFLDHLGHTSVGSFRWRFFHGIMDTSRILAWSWRKNCWNCSLESWGIRLTSAKTWASSARFLFLKPPKVWEAGPLVPTCYNKLPLRKNRDFLSAKS